MENNSDTQLIAQIKRGDKSSFETLINRHKQFAYAIAVKVVNNHEDAEEIAHDAFIQFYKKINTFKGDSKFTTWFYRIVLNIAIAKTRKKKIPTDDITDHHVAINQPSDIENSNDLFQSERKKYLNQAMTLLSPEERGLLGLYYFKELSMEEMEEITGMNTNNMKVKLFRARKKLAKHLEKLLPAEVSSIY